MTPALAVGGVGLLAAIAGWIVAPHDFYAGWLAATTVFAAWPLGSVALLLIHALTGGRWGDALRPALRLGVCTMPLLFLAALPVGFGFSALYPWAGHGARLANAFYLNVPFFVLRCAVYTLVWAALGVISVRSADLSRYAPAGLFALGITVTFAAIDATMSLDPHFTSSIYGMIAGAGMVLSALSIAILFTAERAPPDTREDLGKLLLACVILWIYLDFMQLLIVWQSDLAADAPWYLQRSRGGWGALRIAIALGHFALPLALLISPVMQRSPRVLVRVAALLIAMEMLRGWWTVLPSVGLAIGWVDVACMAALAGFAVALALWTGRHPSLMARDHV